MIKGILHKIKNDLTFDVNDTKEIEKLTILYPYFQTTQILFSKTLLDTNSILYNRQLKKAALYSQDRNKLFKLITKNNTNSNINTKNEELDTHLDFSKEEKYSFSEWLNITKLKKIKRGENKTIVDNFITKNPSIKRPNKSIFFKAENEAKHSLTENEDLVTPTLAKVYLNQKHFKKAINAYEKLILKFPEKSSLFAKQIELINKIKE